MDEDEFRSMSMYGKSQFVFDREDDSDIVEAVRDSKEQLLTVVRVVIIEFGDEDGAETVNIEELELGDGADTVLLEELQIIFVLLLLLLLIVVVFCVVDVEIDDVFVNKSLELSGSSADCEDKLSTEPQFIVLVLQLSSSSTSPNPESASVQIEDWAGDEEAS